MGNYTGPKVRLSRRFGVPIAETAKHMRLRRENPPGMHGGRRSRPSLYGVQLTEKQKLMFYYNIRDKQMRRYMAEAQKSKLNAPEALHQVLETRLDNVIRRLGWSRTIWQARQMVVHGHFEVNGRKVDIPSFRVSTGDRIRVKDKSKKFVKATAETAEFQLNLDWLKRDEEKHEAEVTRLPTLEDSRIPFEINYNMIIEFYTR